MIRSLIFACAGLGALLLTGCSSLSVNSDWDQKADFSQYQTYSVMKPQSPASDLVERRIVDAIRVHLNERGFTEDETNPDMIVAPHVNVKDRVDVQTYNYGYPYAGYGYGYYPYWHGGTDVAVSEYQEGTLVLDIVDGADREMVWRGWGTKIIDDKSGDAFEIQKVVDKILEQYPPN
jgi:hypothetical protein